MKKIAVVAGIVGQDSVGLAQFLPSKGYVAYSMFRRTASANCWRMAGFGWLGRSGIRKGRVGLALKKTLEELSATTVEANFVVTS